VADTEPAEQIPNFGGLKSGAGRKAYIRALIKQGFIKSENALLARHDLVAETQRLWHAKAEQGCRFAAVLSQRSDDHDRMDEVGWFPIVVTGVGDKLWSKKALVDLNAQIERLARRVNAAQALSVIFPAITKPEALIRLVRELGALPRWTLEAPPIDEKVKPPLEQGMLNIGLRYEVATGCSSYALGLGPFAFLPRTRRAPFTEIALVAKPARGATKSSRLPRKAHEAHLAYMNIDWLEPDAFEKLIDTTMAHRLLLLGGENPSAKARVTLVVPADLWEAAA
jgi:hypothetical protein